MAESSLTAQASILIVEDDSHFRETLTDALALKRLRVRGVSSGQGALEALEEELPSLIVMDVQLPDAHGFDLCRKLRRSPRLKSVPIIFLSARYTEPADRAEGLLAGADAYLSKPVNLDVLWEEVNYLLDKRENP
ncbi:MAG: response regulator [Elusimicrobia bacterium]|nr:response regulator [Elusimicrobiota bacterium]